MTSSTLPSSYWTGTSSGSFARKRKTSGGPVHCLFRPTQSGTHKAHEGPPQPPPCGPFIQVVLPERPGSLLPPHLTALPDSEDIGAASPPIHRGCTVYTLLPPRLQTEVLCRLGLLPISVRVVSGFNQRKPPSRTLAIAVDISKEFDTVSHRLLIKMIQCSRLRHNLVRWLVAYL